MKERKVFQKAVNRMPVLMRQLLQAPLLSRDSLGDIPGQGIYVFYEKGKPLYVGRSRNLRTRILNHGRRSSSHFQATFAFLIAMKKARLSSIKRPPGRPERKPTRRDWEKHEPFSGLFAAAKERVARMKVRVMDVPDTVEQTLFEVYAADRFGTLGRYNLFETH